MKPNKPSTPEAWLEHLGQPAADRDYRPGHQRMHALLGSVESHRPAARIRIAGTNGKGSTAFFLAAALQAAGENVGLYTSPHLLHFNERIRINGQPVSDEVLCSGLDRLMPSALACGASYFETTTALALDCFARARVDIEILEAGVGARLDATTAVAADGAIITPIGLDHQNWLGTTLEDIAWEKAHATLGCAWAVSAPQKGEVKRVLEEFFPDIDFVTQPVMQTLRTFGTHQRMNAALALAALKKLDESVDLQHELRAIAAVQVPGRMQCMRCKDAEIWLDAAHNIHAVKTLYPLLESLAPFDAIMVLTRGDRDLSEAAPDLERLTRRLHTGNNPSLTKSYLHQELGNNPNGRFLVTGSFMSVAAALEYLGKKKEKN